MPTTPSSQPHAPPAIPVSAAPRTIEPHAPRARRWQTLILRLGVGLMLIACGLLFLLETFGFVEVEQLWRLWPLGVIALGAQSILGEDRRVGSGAAITLVGLWLLVNTLQVAGVTFRSSWPALLIGLGVLVTVRGLTDLGNRGEIKS